MNSKLLAIVGYLIVFLTLYFVTAGVWFGAMLLNGEDFRFWLVMLDALVAAGLTVWFLKNALDESEKIDMRRMDATASLSSLAMCITCIAMLLLPETLLHQDALWLFFRVSCVFVAVVLIGVAVTLALGTFREEKRP